jgi:hypothetical protein
MKLFIPACGDRITLTVDWTFLLYLESRNMAFAKKRKLVAESADKYGEYEGGESGPALSKVTCTLPAGTVLECDRVYIRTFNKSAIEVGNDYDSITWKVIKKGKAETHGRFWAKLSDCNGLGYDLEPDSLYRDRVKSIKAVMNT